MSPCTSWRTAPQLRAGDDFLDVLQVLLDIAQDGGVRALDTAALDYSIQEMRASAMAGKSLDTRKAESARYQIDYLNNKIQRREFRVLNVVGLGLHIVQLTGEEDRSVLCAVEVAGLDLPSGTRRMRMKSWPTSTVC